jgi:hypothetical protein
MCIAAGRKHCSRDTNGIRNTRATRPRAKNPREDKRIPAFRRAAGRAAL